MGGGDYDGRLSSCLSFVLGSIQNTINCWESASNLFYGIEKLVYEKRAWNFIFCRLEELKLIVDRIFILYSKAFDTLDHTFLFQKLNHYGLAD